MSNEEIKKIVERYAERGKMAYLDPASEEDISVFEKKNNVTLPEKYKLWLQFSDGGELFLPAGMQFYGVAHKPLINVEDVNRPSEDYVVIGAMSFGDPILFEKGKENISIFNHEAGRIEEDETYEDFYAFLNDLDGILGIGG